MRKGNLTREQAIEYSSLADVVRVESENCEPTNRVGYNGACQDDDETEWSASVMINSDIGLSPSIMPTLVAYYYTTTEQDEAIAEAYGDGSVIDWAVAGYEIV